MNRGVKAGITGLVAVHLAVTLWHGDAHQHLGVVLTPEKQAFVYVVIIVAPVVAALLVWTRAVRVGVWVFFLSMLASLLFGVHHHYVLPSADHVRHLPGGGASARSAFIASAAALAVVEFVSTFYGALCLRRLRREA